jgi:HSP20 family protein
MAHKLHFGLKGSMTQQGYKRKPKKEADTMSITKWRAVQHPECRPFWMEGWSPMTRMLDEVLGGNRGDLMVWGPNVDILENDDAFEIHAELPGVTQEDVKITLDNNTLTLSGEKKQVVKDERNNALRIERSYGKFERSFSLPSSIKSDAVRANFEDGVLRIVLPKAEAAKSRTISIETK